MDSKPQNPDEMILQCSNEDCRRWQHVKCIAEATVQRAADEASGTKKSTPKKSRPKAITISADSLAQAKAQTDSFTAEVLIQGLPNGESHTQAEKSEIIVTNAQGEKQTQDVTCLFCHNKIE